MPKKHKTAVWSFLGTCMPVLVVPTLSRRFIANSKLSVELPVVCTTNESKPLHVFVHDILQRMLPDNIFVNAPLKEVFCSEMGVYFSNNKNLFKKTNNRFEYYSITLLRIHSNCKSLGTT